MGGEPEDVILVALDEALQRLARINDRLSRVVECRYFGGLTEAETARVLGVPIPVQGLAAWLRGEPRGVTPSSIERDARGRTAVLAQDGWEIVYAYGDDASVQPARLTLRYTQGEPTEVRLVLDRWE